jgi:hypothetical protein
MVNDVYFLLDGVSFLLVFVAKKPSKHYFENRSFISELFLMELVPLVCALQYTVHTCTVCWLQKREHETIWPPLIVFYSYTVHTKL